MFNTILFQGNIVHFTRNTFPHYQIKINYFTLGGRLPITRKMITLKRLQYFWKLTFMKYFQFTSSTIKILEKPGKGVKSDSSMATTAELIRKSNFLSVKTEFSGEIYTCVVVPPAHVEWTRSFSEIFWMFINQLLSCMTKMMKFN